MGQAIFLIVGHVSSHDYSRLTGSTPIMVLGGRPRNLARERRMGHDSTNTLYPNRGTSRLVEIPNHHHPPLGLYQRPPTPRPWSSTKSLAQCTRVRYPTYRTTQPFHGTRPPSRKPPLDAPRPQSNGSHQDTPDRLANESRIDTELSIPV